MTARRTFQDIRQEHLARRAREFVFSDLEIDILERALGVFRSEFDHEPDFPFAIVGELRQGLAAARGDSIRYPRP